MRQVSILEAALAGESARAGSRARPAPSREVQQLYFRTFGQGVRVLALLGVDPGVDAHGLALELSEVAAQLGAGVEVLDARGVQLSGAAPQLAAVREARAHGRCAVVVLDPVLQNQTGLPLAHACEAVLLAVGLGDTRFAELQGTLELVGRERVLGSVLVKRDA